MRRFLTVAMVAGAAVVSASRAEAREIQLTGPLAGAPAVRHLRLHREKRFEIAPVVSFSLLDAYQREIYTGIRANYHFTDWLGVGFFGTFGAIKVPTGVVEQAQTVTAARRDPNTGEPNDIANGNASTNNRLTAASIGSDLKKQLGTIGWVFSPQVTVVPFRGKLALFEKTFVDTDAYFFAGPAIVGISDRGNCGQDGGTRCTDPASFDVQSRTAFTASFGLGFAFYTGKWMGFGLEWRGLPVSYNTGGFDTRGSGPDGKFPDGKIDDHDRRFTFVQMLSLSFNMYLPAELKSSD